jgi:formate dehydrogenase subunit gamma
MGGDRRGRIIGVNPCPEFTRVQVEAAKGRSVMEKRTIERYSKAGIVFHWVFSFLVLILVLTGISMFVPGRGPEGGYATGFTHRICAALFLAIPLLYSLLSPGRAAAFLKDTLDWGTDDLRWFMKAPDYYFGGSGENMPLQDRLNTGQKLWQLVLILTAVLFLVTGSVMWFFKSAIAVNIYQWLLLFHGAAFIIFLFMLIVHLYMSGLHPHMRESLHSMIDGKVSAFYAREHHRKWYERIEGRIAEGKRERKER